MWSFLAFTSGLCQVVKDVDLKKDPRRDFDELNEQQLTNIILSIVYVGVS